MASLIYLNTHIMAWLYAGQTERIPAAVRKAVNESELLISPMALVKLQYLIEIGRRFTEAARRDATSRFPLRSFSEAARQAATNHRKHRPVLRSC